MSKRKADAKFSKNAAAFRAAFSNGEWSRVPKSVRIKIEEAMGETGPPSNEIVLLVHPTNVPQQFSGSVIGCIGPFPHRDAAEKWATEHLKDFGWSVADLCHPNTFYEGRSE